VKIGVLSQWFDPEPGPAAIPGVLARELVRAGHDVSVLTGFPNYPSGRVYSGYRQRIRSKSLIDGYNLTRVPLYPSHDGSALGRLANYSSFALAATAFGRPALKNLDGIWVYNSPITVSLPLLMHSSWGRTPYFLQVQDLWPDSLIESGMFPRGAAGWMAEAVVSSIVRLTENRAGVIGVSSESARALLLQRNHRLRPERIVSSPNPTDETIFRPVRLIPGDSIPDVSWKGKFTVMYVGAVGEVQGLDVVLQAASLLRTHSDIHIVIVGDGIAQPRLKAEAESRGLNNVTFVGRVDKSLVPGYMATANVQLVSLAEKPFLSYTTPSKIASLLASEVPIIGQLSGDGARLIEASGAGFVVEPGKAGALVDAVQRMASLSESGRAGMAMCGRAYYDKNLAASVVAGNVAAALEGAGAKG
jgi:colanic acid biosynthesis glycosyl transferase WcaI